MSLYCCESKCKCALLSIAASIVIGVIAAFLQLTAVINVTPAFLWVLLGIAVVYLGVLVIAGAIKSDCDGCECVCATLSTVLGGILGTVLFSIILLGVTFAEASVIGAIFVGLLLLSISLVITASACLVKCLFKCGD